MISVGHASSVGGSNRQHFVSGSFLDYCSIFSPNTEPFWHLSNNFLLFKRYVTGTVGQIDSFHPEVFYKSNRALSHVKNIVNMERNLAIKRGGGMLAFILKDLNTGLRESFCNFRDFCSIM